MKKIFNRICRMAASLAILSGVAFGATELKADVVTPYSMYGYGVIGDRATSYQRQMGSVGYAMRSGRQVNVMNPASYAAIDSLTFLFDMGADISFLWSEENNSAGKKQRDRQTGGGLDYLTMQFPIGKYMGGSIGMLPYTNVGYSFGNEIAHGAVENSGRGGINQAYIGFAGQFKGAALGVNVSYDFGNIINDYYATPENSGQSLTERVMQIRDWNIVIGAQYTAKLDRENSLSFGLTYSPKKSLHGKTWVTTQELRSDAAADTIGSIGLKGNFEMPTTIGAGVSFKHERSSRWMMEFDVTYQEWSKVKYSGIPLLPDKNGIGQTDGLAFSGMKFSNRMRYAAGGEWVPKIRGNYAERMAYRIGAYYCDDYLKLDGNRVREYGVTCGVGLHTPQDKTMINIGFEWKNRRAYPNQLIGENYFNITLGVNFNELWFWQRKIR
ncbi:MAG: hypothetical protein K2M88_08145 [Muribaculaceae bacterium]|nr:hypothetical protein [Muribaculaceae bacterium]